MDDYVPLKVDEMYPDGERLDNMHVNYNSLFIATLSFEKLYMEVDIPEGGTKNASQMMTSIP